MIHAKASTTIPPNKQKSYHTQNKDTKVPSVVITRSGIGNVYKYPFSGTWEGAMWEVSTGCGFQLRSRPRQQGPQSVIGSQVGGARQGRVPQPEAQQRSAKGCR